MNRCLLLYLFKLVELFRRSYPQWNIQKRLTEQISVLMLMRWNIPPHSYWKALLCLFRNNLSNRSDIRNYHYLARYTFFITQSTRKIYNSFLRHFSYPKRYPNCFIGLHLKLLMDFDLILSWEIWPDFCWMNALKSCNER